MRVLEQPEKQISVKLDLKDKKILLMLAKNSRIPATAIAKQVGLSRDAVSYRIRNLMKNKVLQGYRTLVNVGLLGYEAYHVFIQLNPPEKEAEKEMVEKFKSHPSVRAVLRFSDKYDYELAVIAKSIREFDVVLSQLLNICKEFLKDYEILVITDFIVENSFPLSFLETTHPEAQPSAGIKKGAKPFAGLDKKDLHILKLLSNDASLPLYTVANKSGLSADAVNYRLKKMQAAGVVKKFVPVINYAALGYTIYAVLLNIKAMSTKTESRLKQILSSDKNMLWAVKTIGRYNVLMYICAPSTEEFHKTLLGLRSSFQAELNHYETLIAYEEYKYTYFPDCIADSIKAGLGNSQEKN